MNKFNRTAAALCLSTMAFFCLWGWIGDYDYCEKVILHMTQVQYDSVKNYLTEDYGHEPSDREIAHWWAEHNGNE